MVIGVGEESFEFLQRNSNKLSCGMGKALFSVVKGQRENQDAMHEHAHNNRAQKKKFSGGTKRNGKRHAPHNRNDRPDDGARGNVSSK